jgi:Domain of unknown function (DUF5615)
VRGRRLRLAADENFKGQIFRGLLLRIPNLDIVRVQDESIAGGDDPQLLQWAEEQSRIVISHDRRTLPYFAYQRVREGKRVAGVFIVYPHMAIGQAIEELLLTNRCSEMAEWENVVLYFPL